MSIARTIAGSVLVIAAGAVLATVAAGAATARPESAPEPPAVQSTRFGQCPLERIDDQFVRCEDLTGAGVAAPAWLPEQ
jgi:hypothetical protein